MLQLHRLCNPSSCSHVLHCKPVASPQQQHAVEDAFDDIGRVLQCLEGANVLQRKGVKWQEQSCSGAVVCSVHAVPRHQTQLLLNL